MEVHGDMIDQIVHMLFHFEVKLSVSISCVKAEF